MPSSAAPAPASLPATQTPAAHPAAQARVREAWQALHGVPDPEVPAISVTELGIVREVIARDDGFEVVVTPTYSGCPATEVIAQAVADAIDAAGLGPARVTQRRAPAWTTDWITPEGRDKLRRYGIAPPGRCGDGDGGLPVGHASPVRLMARDVDCPRCGSPRTERLAAFGSTACKSLHRCIDCREPFEYFKPI